MPKIAFVPIFYIWFGPILSIYVMALIISLFITVLTHRIQRLLGCEAV
jgi:NitT/TauT family transport system permease protein